MKKGMTFSTVIIAVIIMLVFASTATVSVIKVSNDSTLTKFATEIAYVQEAVNNYYDKNNEYPVGISINVDLSQVSINDKVEFNLEDNNNNTIILYKLDYSKLGNIETVYGNNSEDNDVYAVSKKTGKVYYLKGVKVGNTTYFTLTDSLKQRINYVDTNENTITKDGISFIKSTDNWTNQKVITRVLVPNKYTNISVSVIKEDGTTTNITTNFEVNSYLEYRIENVDGNYTIIVSYKNTNGDNLKQTQPITNYDNVSPTVNVSDRIDLVSKDTSENYSYIKVENPSDSLSGIKYIKYERENIDEADAINYFKTNGIELQNDIIELKDETKYVTIYIEDNAGNYLYKRIYVEKK